MAFETAQLGALDLDKVFGDEANRPMTWHKFRMFVDKLAEDVNFAAGTSPQTIDMADAAVGLVGDNPGAGEVVITSTTLLVDANSAGTEELTLNEASIPKGLYTIVNTGGESIVVKNTAAATIGTIATAESAVVSNDGTTLVFSL